MCGEFCVYCARACGYVHPLSGVMSRIGRASPSNICASICVSAFEPVSVVVSVCACICASAASMSYSINPDGSVSACVRLTLSPRLVHLLPKGLQQGLHELMIDIDRQLLELLHCLACFRLPTFRFS